MTSPPLVAVVGTMLVLRAAGHLVRRRRGARRRRRPQSASCLCGAAPTGPSRCSEARRSGRAHRRRRRPRARRLRRFQRPYRRPAGAGPQPASARRSPRSVSALLFGPRLARLASELTAERRARIRSEEKAEIAAHLHDGVLQTLALIQHRAGTNREVARSGPPAGARAARVAVRRHRPTRPPRSRGALTRDLAAVEDDQQVPVELVAGRRRSRSTSRPRLLVAAVAGGGHERRPPRRRRPRRRLRRGRGRRAQRLRPRPRQGLRSGRGARRSPRHSPTASSGACGASAARATVRSHPGEGTEVSVQRARGMRIVTCAGLPRRRPRAVPHRRARRAGRSRHDVVGEAADVDEAVARIPAARPDVVLLDVHLPGGGGAEVLRRVLAAVARGSLPRPVGVGRARRRHRRHPRRCPRLRDEVDHRATSLPTPSARVASRRRRLLAPPGRLRARRLRRRPARPPLDSELDALTPREREVLRLIARGYTLQGDRPGARAQREDHRDATCRPCCASCSCPTATS